jgi:hypothetical protein
VELKVFGIRHHGPGCARSLVAALQEYKPDVLLVEGPPEANELVALVEATDMQPPVALLIYPPDEPQRAVFYPFAEFSPEWQSLLFARQNQIAARFIDLPQQHRLAMEREADEQASEVADEPAEAPSDIEEPTSSVPDAELVDDPLGALAMAAGYSDRELWWEHQIEQRQDPTDLFQGIMEAMVELRSGTSSQQASQESPSLPFHRRYEALREAHMRQEIRQANRDGFQRAAVVCGAWHAPVLANPGPAKSDAELLKGLPKTKVAASWAPWTFSRLAMQSGYGAGVVSPGWYEHLWRYSGGGATHWVTKAARLLRAEDLDASSASVIETVRLAEAVASLRGLPMAGLAELSEAILSVLCRGEEVPLALIRNKLEIGTRLGSVPADSPTLPIQNDLASHQKRLRLKPTTEIKSLDLDLRKLNDRDRSCLLHRLKLLNIPWGESQQAYGKSGTFHELWRLQWQVEFVVNLIEANVWGNTVEAACTGSVRHRAAESDTLSELTQLLDGAILAALPIAVTEILQRLEVVGAIATDVRRLMDALPPLARVIRYGDVRETPTERLKPVLAGFLERIFVGLPAACSSLDDEAAEQMVASISCVQESLDVLQNQEQLTEWQAVLQKLMTNDSLHGLLRGTCCRFLLNQGVLPRNELIRLASLALSPAVGASAAGAWIEGLLRGSGLVLLHEDELWMVLDAWIVDLSEETFVELLPVLRRAFSGFQAPERRAMGEKVKGLRNQREKDDKPELSTSRQLDMSRGRLVLPVLAHILGIELPEGGTDVE